MYFRFLTLVAFHAFIDLKVSCPVSLSCSLIYIEQVDATVLEVGVGGKYDCTNLVPKPVVAGVTSLGIDHIFVLGKTLSEIAWQKGGIFKVCSRNLLHLTANCVQEGAPAFTVHQPEEGLTMLRHRAEELKVRGSPSSNIIPHILSQASKFVVVPPTPELADIKLGTLDLSKLNTSILILSIRDQASPVCTKFRMLTLLYTLCESSSNPGGCHYQRMALYLRPSLRVLRKLGGPDVARPFKTPNMRQRPGSSMAHIRPRVWTAASNGSLALAWVLGSRECRIAGWLIGSYMSSLTSGVRPLGYSYSIAQAGDRETRSLEGFSLKQRPS